MMNLTTYRPCLIDGQTKAIFHGWYTSSHVIPPSALRGGHNGGTVTDFIAVVEFADGSIKYVRPENIRFLDSISLFKKCDFGDD